MPHALIQIVLQTQRTHISIDVKFARYWNLFLFSTISSLENSCAADLCWGMIGKDCLRARRILRAHALPVFDGKWELIIKWMVIVGPRRIFNFLFLCFYSRLSHGSITMLWPFDSLAQ